VKKGSLILVKVVEVVSVQNLIVSWEGKLIGVQNHTSHKYQIGDHIELYVNKESPLELKIQKDKNFYI